MKRSWILWVCAAVLALPFAAVSSGAQGANGGTSSGSTTLWYDREAKNWMKEALPIGNGRLGGMVFGGVDREHIQFNEDSMWVGDETHTGCYQAFGDLYINLGPAGDKAANQAPASNYRRDLDLSRAVETVRYTQDGVNFRREYFASHPAGVMVFHLTADKPGAYTGSIELTDMHAGKIVAQDNRLSVTGSLAGYTYRKEANYTIALNYEAQVVVLHDGGEVKAEDGRISFSKANSLTILLDAGTDYLADSEHGWRGAPPHAAIMARLDAAEHAPYDKLLSDYLSDYQSLFGRVSLDLGSTASDLRNLPTDQRLKSYENGANDPELEALLFQYGRYLLISSSRDALPANLQGLWNDSNRPPWRCDWHGDINVEMNYWPAEVTNLSECAIPFFHWLDSCRAVRRKDAWETQHRRGWVMYFENGAFGAGSWGHCSAAGAWCALALWEHYAFTGDKEYLRNTAYPMLKELCEYWDDALIREPDGTLVAPADFSPEHGPKSSEGISFDQQLVFDLFTHYIAAAKILGVDGDYAAKISGMRDKLLAPKIGSWGQLQEWMTDRDDPKETHRHTSNLIALFPGSQISPRTTPALAEAAKVSLIHRGDESTGWALAWRISLWARLLDGDHSYKLIRRLIHSPNGGGESGGLYDNLLDVCPPFQIDGNFGLTAGMSEMLLQSQLGTIDLLPALPKAWPTGKVTGLRARGGCTVDIAWENGRVIHYRIASSDPTPVKVNFNGESKMVMPGKGWLEW